MRNTHQESTRSVDPSSPKKDVSPPESSGNQVGPVTYQFYTPRAISSVEDEHLTIHVSPVVTDPTKVSQLLFPLDLEIDGVITGYAEIRFAIYRGEVQTGGTSIMAIPCIGLGPSREVHHRNNSMTDQLSVWVGEGIPDHPLMTLNLPEVQTFKWLCQTLPFLSDLMVSRNPVRKDELILITKAILDNFPDERTALRPGCKSRRSYPGNDSGGVVRQQRLT